MARKTEAAAVSVAEAEGAAQELGAAWREAWGQHKTGWQGLRRGFQSWSADAPIEERGEGGVVLCN